MKHNKRLDPEAKSSYLTPQYGNPEHGDEIISRPAGKDIAMGNDRIPWVFQPFAALWNLLALALGITGRLIALILGLAFTVMGIIFMLTILGVPAGLVLAALGFLLIARSLF